jgi:hypothetical protein
MRLSRFIVALEMGEMKIRNWAQTLKPSSGCICIPSYLTPSLPIDVFSPEVPTGLQVCSSTLRAVNIWFLVLLDSHEIATASQVLPQVLPHILPHIKIFPGFGA